MVKYGEQRWSSMGSRDGQVWVELFIKPFLLLFYDKI